jgi:hypothetical protein
MSDADRVGPRRDWYRVRTQGRRAGHEPVDSDGPQEGGWSREPGAPA